MNNFGGLAVLIVGVPVLLFALHDRGWDLLFGPVLVILVTQALPLALLVIAIMWLAQPFLK